MAVLIVALCLLLAAPAAGQADPPDQLPLTGYPVVEGVIVDGDLSEWTREGALELDRGDQLNKFDNQTISTRWGGAKDLSATFFIRHSRDALYLGGRVIDDHTQYRDVQWWLGDAIEVFIDADYEGDREENHFSDDDFQIFLMPHNPGRQWGVSFQGRRSILGDNDFVGVEVGYQAVPGGYTFEAVFPFINFPMIPAGCKTLGFNIAITDHDLLDDGTERHNYITANGATHIFHYPWNMCRLDLEGPPPEVVAGIEKRGASQARNFLLTVVLSLLGIVAATFFSVKIYSAAQRYFPRWRYYGVGLFFFFMFFILVVPSGIVRWRAAGVRSLLTECTATVSAIAAELCSVDVARGRGGIRTAESLNALLSGETIRIADDYTYKVVDLGCNPTTNSYASGIPFFDYGFSLTEGTEFVFAAPEATPLSEIALSLRSAFKSPLAQGVARGGVIGDALDVGVRFANGEERVLQSLGLLDCKRSMLPPAGSPCSLAWERNGEQWHQHLVTLSEEEAQVPVSAIVVRLVNPNVDVDLAGITGLRAGRGAAPLLFYLGNRTENGVPTWLRNGTMPRGCVRSILPSALGPNESRAGAFLFRVSGAPDVLFLVYTSKDITLFEKEKYGAEVARFVLRFADGREESQSVLAGVHVDHWTRDHPEAMESRRAYQWLESGEERHYDILRIDLDRTNPLEEVLVLNCGETSSPFILGAATTGIRVGRTPVTSGLLREEGDALSVAHSLLTGSRDLNYTIFENRRARACSHSKEISDRLIGTGLPAEALSLIPSEDFVFSDPLAFQAGGLQFLGVYMGISAADGSRLILRAALELQPIMAVGALQKTMTLVAVFLFLPFFIMFFVDLLGRIRMVRLKLTSLFILTSVVPIVFLSLLMFNHLNGVREDQMKQHLRRAVAAAKSELERLVLDASAVGRAGLQASELMDVVSAFELNEEILTPFLKSWREENFAADGIERAVRLEVILDDGERRLFFDSDDHIHSSIFDDTESGLYFHWGKVSFVGTAERQRAPRLRLSVGGVVGAAYLRGLAETSECDGMVIADAQRGLPVVDAGLRERFGERKKRQWSINDWFEKRKETYLGEREDNVLVACDPLPARGRALMLEAQSLKKGFLYPVTVFLTEMEIEDFFLLFGAIILASAIFIGTVTTDGIIRPFEKLKDGADAVSRGDLAFRIDAEGGTEMGRLAQAFNSMTGQLELRMDEQQRLTRNMEELSAGLDFQGKVAAALRMLGDDLQAERAVFFFFDQQMGRFSLLGDSSKRAEEVGSFRTEEFIPGESFLAASLRSREPRVFARPGESDLYGAAERAVHDVVVPDKPLVVLPLSVQRRNLGTILVVLREDPGTLDLVNRDYLASMAQQIAVSFENARLYLMAIQDPATGFYFRAFFRHRLAEELDRTVHGGGKLALLRLSFENLEQIRSRNLHRADAILDRMSAIIKKFCRDMYIVGRNAPGEFDILLPDADRRVGTALARSVLRELDAGKESVDGEEPHFQSGLAFCPDEASSAEFLFAQVARSLEENKRGRAEGEDSEATEAASVARSVETFGYVFASSRMNEILATIPRIAQSSISVLVFGETGVGKEVLAEIIHHQSGRADHPLVRLNCSALPESLLESELFGHEKGAFTGAERRKAGHFEAADKGTLFLDEVGDLTLRTQAKLLRVLQDKTIEPLGSSGKPLKVDVRIIAATNRDLPSEIGQDRFREDLYFRLKVITLAIPPLRERKEDIPALARRFIEEFNRDNNRNIRHMSPAALDRCFRYKWPGNVRELKNVLNRAMLFAENDLIEPAHLVFESAESEQFLKAHVPMQEDAERKLNSRQAQLLTYLQASGSITNRQYMEMMGISSRTGLRDLQEMIKLGLIVRFGSRRAAVYKLKKNRAIETGLTET